MRIVKWLPRFRKAYRALDALAERENWPRPEIEAFQLERLNAVWAHAVAHVPYYRRLAAEAGLPPRFAGFDEFRAAVPVLPRSTVQADPAAFLSEKAAPGRWVCTGGSTGTPMNAYWGAAAHLEMLQVRYRLHAAWGVDIFDRTAFLWGHSAAFLPGLAGGLASLRQPVEDWLRNRIRLSAYRLGREDLREHLRRIAAFRPVSLYGYSRALYLLAREAETTRFRCDSLKLVTLTGEPALPDLVAVVEKAFGVPAVVEYGSVECGVLAGEGPDRTLRVREDAALVETVPREDGRCDLVVTVLNNPSFPLLRYAIADVTDAPLAVPDRGFAALKNVVGRNNDLIVSRTGRFIHSARFDALLKTQGAMVRGFRVRQYDDGSLSVALELDDPAASLNVVRLERKIRKLVDGCPVKIELVDAIPQTAAGKHRLVLSDLDVANRPAGAPPAGKDAGGRNTAPLVPVSPGRTTAPFARATALKRLIRSPALSFIMEAHNGLSARIAEEAGFEAVWASGLSISAAMGVRDANEASWTQVLEVLEFMSDSTRVPILVDGDTGYGNFNNARRLIRKLEDRGIAGVCIEDKVFPKTNSFLRGTAQPLANVDEFCGKIKAAKDAQRSEDFVLVARVEAFIAGWGLEEAMTRAEAYRKAGADAILIHSAQRSAREVLTFKEEWGDRLPVVIVPTKYYATPTEVFRKFGFSAVIWANHLMRSCITAMQQTTREIHEEQTLVRVEDRVAPLAEVFRLQGAAELEEAEKRYLPRQAGDTRAVILAAARGKELGEMTAARPKCMVPIAGVPLLRRVVGAYRAAGVNAVTVVRGYCKEAVTLDGVQYADNDEAATTGEVFSLYQARAALNGPCLVSYGDVLFRKYVAEELMEVAADFAVAVDPSWQESAARGRPARYAACSAPHSRLSSCGPVRLLDVGPELEHGAIHGQWMGFLKASEEGACFLRGLLDRFAADGTALRYMDIPGLLREIIRAGKEVRVVYTTGQWFDVDGVEDVLAGGSFQ